MDYDKDQMNIEIGKGPFFGAAAFVLFFILIFVSLSIKENGILDHWVMATCLLGTGLIVILVFLPFFLQGLADRLENPKLNSDSELANKAFYELKEVRSELDALSVKIDKVPTLVEKIIAGAINHDDNPLQDKIIEELNLLQNEVSSKLDKIEETAMVPSLLPEPDPKIEELQKSFKTIESGVKQIIKRINLLHDAQSEYPEPSQISENLLEQPETTNQETENEEPRGLSDKELSGSEDDMHGESPDLNLEFVNDEEEALVMEERTQESIPKDRIGDQSGSTEKKETAQQIDSFSSGLEDLASQKQPESSVPDESKDEESELGLPDPAETLRKVDALLAGEDPSSTIEKPESTEGKQAQNSTTTVVANVMIGIGNKPFLRGEGPGLSWDVGVSMNFVEIGKWAWSPPRKNAPLTVQVYRNDQDPDNGGKIEVAPGQKLEITPNFS